MEMAPVSSETTTAIASDSSVMPSPARCRRPRLRQRLALAHREDASGRGDAAIPHHDAAVMEGGFWMKYGQKQLDGKMGVDDHACFLVNPDRRVALDRDERAELFVGQLGDRFRDVVHSLALLACERENRMAAQFGQTTAQLRLENDDERHGQENGETADDPADDDRFRQLGAQGQGQKTIANR